MKNSNLRKNAINIAFFITYLSIKKAIKNDGF